MLSTRLSAQHTRVTTAFGQTNRVAQVIDNISPIFCSKIRFSFIEVTARCAFSTLQTFISTASALQIVDQKNLQASAQDTTTVFVNSFIVFACASGYVNTGGSLNVTCLSTGSWTQFPNCILNNGAVTTATTTPTIMTTTLSSSTGTACIIDSSTFTVTNGYYVSSSLTYASATTASGNLILSYIPITLVVSI